MSCVIPSLLVKQQVYSGISSWMRWASTLVWMLGANSGVEKCSYFSLALCIDVQMFVSFLSCVRTPETGTLGAVWLRCYVLNEPREMHRCNLHTVFVMWGQGQRCGEGSNSVVARARTVLSQAHWPDAHRLNFPFRQIWKLNQDS